MGKREPKDDAAKKPQWGDPLTMRVDPAVKKRFRRWCVDNDREMTEVLVGFIEQVLADEVKPPPFKRRRHTTRPRKAGGK